ncbi:MAG: manganese efflux pump [Clostridia bacterium]|nr:manganese efflux pump [Clostridia bacterium]
MDFILLVGVAISLSMDAFAVSICRGLQMKDGINVRHMLIIAAFFGGFQGLMPAIGYILGKQFESFIEPVDHWVAFVLLGFLGGKMIFDVIKEIRSGEDDECDCCGGLNIKQLLIMAVATSIDALAVGITLPTLGVSTSLQALTSVLMIGIITFAICMLGVAIGNRFGARFKNKASLAGGIVLILVGTKILLEHLGIIHF